MKTSADAPPEFACHIGAGESGGLSAALSGLRRLDFRFHCLALPLSMGMAVIGSCTRTHVQNYTHECERTATFSTIELPSSAHGS